MQRPVVYLSGDPGGAFSVDWWRSAGCWHRCYSFSYLGSEAMNYSVRQSAEYAAFLKAGGRVMMDSSAYSIHRLERAARRSGRNEICGVPLGALPNHLLRGYAKFILIDGNRWDFYVTFDYIKDCRAIWLTQQSLVRAGLHPVPVYHGDAGLEWLARYADAGYELICLGRLPAYRGRWSCNRRFYERCFELAARRYSKLRFHGLAMTQLSLLFAYPWQSIDTAGWIIAGYNGYIWDFDFERARMKLIQVTNRGSSPSAVNRVQEVAKTDLHHLIGRYGFTAEDVVRKRDSRILFNARRLLELCQDDSPRVGDGAHWRPLLDTVH